MLQLRPYQREAIESLYGWFQSHAEGNPLVVVPTGGGKSLIIAKICEDALSWPNQRILILTHVRELVEQNFGALYKIWPEAPMGIYCAGLNKKQAYHPVTFASIQSVYNKAEEIGWRDLVLIDEAHLLGDNDGSMYRKFLSALKAINPAMRVVGFSATPYRLKSGWLHKGEGALFSDIAYELPVARLVKEGYLSPLVGKSSIVQGRTDQLGLQGGEFALKEIVTEFDRKEIIKPMVSEIIAYGIDRRAWLIFCASIEHAEHVRDAIRDCNTTVEMICDKTPSAERARILGDFKAGRIRCVTNVSVLTTGFDNPMIDLIALARPTMSPGLLVQMCGRGMRLAEGKQNCLVLDFAANLERHGPITHIEPPGEGSRKDKKDRAGKVCKHCREVVPFSATECPECGAIFEGIPRRIKHAKRASMREAMSDEPIVSRDPVWINVRKIYYEEHLKPGSPNSLRVTYKCGPNTVSEFICFGHQGFARDKAAKWWIARGGQAPVPTTANAALTRLKEIAGVRCARLKVQKPERWLEILTHDLRIQPTVMEENFGNMGGGVTQFFEEPQPQGASA